MEDFQIKIKKSGFKITPGRIAVMQILKRQKTPVDVSKIEKLLKNQQGMIDKATIYRIMESFTSKGLVKRVQFQHNKFYYEAPREEHHHIVCEKCGRIEDVSNCNIKKLEKEIEKLKKFKVKTHSLEFFGVCSLCQQ